LDLPFNFPRRFFVNIYAHDPNTIANANDLPAFGAVDTQIVPSDVKTLPDVPGDTVFKADVLLPNKTPLVVNVPAPVPPFPTGNVPVTPVVSGRPVVLVSTPDAGVPNAGVTNVLLDNVVVLEAVTILVG
jgi:hypothetical protein